MARKMSVGLRKQGSRDALTEWAKARKAWAAQLLVRFGMQTKEWVWSVYNNPHGEGKVDAAHGPVPDWLDLDERHALHETGVAWWDEHHNRCSNSSHEGVDTLYQFKRDKNGKLDSRGDFDEDSPAKLREKYANECRAAFGCAMTRVEAEDAEVVGKRAAPWFYSYRWLLSEGESLDKEAEADAEAHKRRGEVEGRKEWTTGLREEGELYLQDSLEHIAGIGPGKKKTLEELSPPITTVQELLAVDVTAATIPGITHASLKKFQDAARTANGGTGPKDGAFPDHLVKDHREEEHPYKSRYGEEKWREEMWKRSPVCKKYAPIRDMITHMVKESQKMFDGTEHEKDWRMYHDALTTMTCKTTKAWMKNQVDAHGVTYLDRWILPEDGETEDYPMTGARGRPCLTIPVHPPMHGSTDRRHGVRGPSARQFAGAHAMGRLAEQRRRRLTQLARKVVVRVPTRQESA